MCLITLQVKHFKFYKKHTKKHTKYLLIKRHVYNFVGVFRPNNPLHIKFMNNISYHTYIIIKNHPVFNIKYVSKYFCFRLSFAFFSKDIVRQTISFKVC